MSDALRACIDSIVVPHAVSLDAALERVKHMRFSGAERQRFGPGEIRRWHTEQWFPTGLSTMDAVLEHELSHFNASGVSKEMLRAASVCCPHCTRVRIRRGQLSIQGPQQGKMAAALGRIKRLHAEVPLPPFEALLCDRDICRTPGHSAAGEDAACARSAPILVHAKQRSAHHEVAMPENTFSQSYGGNPPWVESRRQLLESRRANPWAVRRDLLAFFGRGAGYRKFLNYSEEAATFEEVTPWLPGVHVHMTPPYTRVPPSHVPMAEQCAERFLLHLPGAWPGHSNKLKQLLACGAVVVMPQNDWYEFWYPLLRPYVHFVPTPNLALYNGHDWPHVRRCLLSHAAEAERIGAEAGRFVQDVLTPRAIDVYMRALLRRLSDLQLRGGAIAQEGRRLSGGVGGASASLAEWAPQIRFSDAARDLTSRHVVNRNDSHPIRYFRFT